MGGAFQTLAFELAPNGQNVETCYTSIDFDFIDTWTERVDADDMG
jgi:hypothetical protein